MEKVGQAIITLLLIFGISCTPKAPESAIHNENQLEVIVEPTIDLFSLVHRLAGDNQYTENLLPEYTSEFDTYFEKYKNHPIIDFVREYDEQHQIDGDAPMALAVYVGSPPDLIPLLDLSDLPPAFDPRWDSTLISNYLEKMRLFAIETNFLEFRERHAEFQDSSIENFREMITKQQIFKWYYDFFGYYPENFKLYLALLNGSSCYGYPVSYPDGEVEFVAIIGARFPDRQGIPTYDKNWFLPIIIHEFTHSYINPLIKGNPDQFQKLGEKLLVTHREKMIERGYNVWNVIIQEYIVRACTICYIEKNEGKRKAKERMQYDIRRGFPEIEGLVKIMQNYEMNREK